MGTNDWLHKLFPPQRLAVLWPEPPQDEVSGVQRPGRLVSQSNVSLASQPTPRPHQCGRARMVRPCAATKHPSGSDRKIEKCKGVVVVVVGPRPPLSSAGVTRHPPALLMEPWAPPPISLLGGGAVIPIPSILVEVKNCAFSPLGAAPSHPMHRRTLGLGASQPDGCAPGPAGGRRPSPGPGVRFVLVPFISTTRPLGLAPILTHWWLCMLSISNFLE